jgi:DNA-binding NarL/FixJ family response regulator
MRCSHWLGHHDSRRLLRKAGRDLTTGETEVLEHKCHGLRNSDIADSMGIAQNTVTWPKCLRQVCLIPRT